MLRFGPSCIHLKTRVRNLCFRQFCDKVVSIGSIKKAIKPTARVDLIPNSYIPHKVENSFARHIQWLMQKNNLRQDVFLIGAPGSLRRAIALSYLEITGQPTEYIFLSRDTTESDLRQRREIQSASSIHIDQCAVRAAIEGRVLVLEGIEKAERNVLPILNNLLENREMQLDDGRFLVSPERYDELSKTMSPEDFNAQKLVRVSENFFIIALGLPVPRFRGNPLDPPFRSRFQSRLISPPPFSETLDAMLKSTSRDSSLHDVLSRIACFAYTVNSEEGKSISLPEFPLSNTPLLAETLKNAPKTELERLVGWLYPHKLFPTMKDLVPRVTELLNKFELRSSSAQSLSKFLVPTIHRTDADSLNSEVTLKFSSQESYLKSDNSTTTFLVPCPTNTSTVHPSDCTSNSDGFVSNDSHNRLLSDMFVTHSVADFCLVGDKGCGKTALVQKFANLLGYDVDTVSMYQDMTARDLLQFRTTSCNGDTVWKFSPLVEAALAGRLVVLDGIDRLHHSTLASLQSLLQDRSLQLFDGSRLLRHDRYDAIKTNLGLDESSMAERQLYRIDPLFRIIATAEPPTKHSSDRTSKNQQRWLNSESLSMFMFHHVQPLQISEEENLVGQLVGGEIVTKLHPLFRLANNLRTSSDPQLSSSAACLSTRQLLRIARSLQTYSQDLSEAIHKACLTRFMPDFARAALFEAMKSAGIERTAADLDHKPSPLAISTSNSHLTVGDVSCPLNEPSLEAQSKIPSTKFFDIPLHVRYIREMLRDFSLGEHLLLIGNQGVGKNKLVDRFLQLLRMPREYIQLHRDTTVQSLTTQAVLQDGVMTYQDSPLVNAVKKGYVLVVDEADKAPTHVTCTLKTLLDSGEMHLPDGRRIVPYTRRSVFSKVPSIIIMHPNFRMIVLANRPGFPFLGNDFFAKMGDLFATHTIDNPDFDSELKMLTSYGPSVSVETLHNLINAFGELRKKVDDGMLTYPYSTRELVNIVKHLEMFPNDSVADVVQNIFHFDAFNEDVRKSIEETLQKYGIPVGANPNDVYLTKDSSMPVESSPKLLSRWSIFDTARQNRSFSSLAKWSQRSASVSTRPIKFYGPVRLPSSMGVLDTTNARGRVFTEQLKYFQFPLADGCAVSSSATSCSVVHRQPGKIGDLLHTVTTPAPIHLFTANIELQTLSTIDLNQLFLGTTPHFFRPRFQLSTQCSSPFDSVLLYEQTTDALHHVNVERSTASRIRLTGLLQRAGETISRDKSPYIMKMNLASRADGIIVRYKLGGNNFQILNTLTGKYHTITISDTFSILNITSLNENQYVISSDDGAKLMVTTEDLDNGKVDVLQLTASNETDVDFGSVSESFTSTVANVTPGQVFDSDGLFAGLVGQSKGENSTDYELYGWTRNERDERKDYFRDNINFDPVKVLFSENSIIGSGESEKFVHLKSEGQSDLVARIQPLWKVSSDHYPSGETRRKLEAFIELVDLTNSRLRYIPVPSSPQVRPTPGWLTTSSNQSGVMLEGLNDNRLATIDRLGYVRIWEVSPGQLHSSLNKWIDMVGNKKSDLDITISDPTKTRKLKTSDSNPLEAPKHGKIDPTNAPHVGGGTWAGGVGGRGTAGLGGYGGPYRLDAGHDVVQVPQELKDAVPESVRQAAREMAEKAFQQRMREIDMSEHDGNLYKSLSESVHLEVQQLRAVIDALQAKSKERQWVRHQTFGDLDESKLIESLTGERTVYKRRAEQPPELGAPQEKPKRLRLAMDVSGSMYRFNGYDGRLQREVEAALMCMQALDGFSDKIKYDIVGHSGDDYAVPFSDVDTPLSNPKQHLQVLQKMHAHAQYCMSGDNTLEAARNAIECLEKTTEDYDESFVIVLSDANLERYGISPRRFGQILRSSDDVNSFAVFIGSLGDQAERLVHDLPAGRSFLCLQTSQLPHVLKQIFASLLLDK